MEYSAHFHSAQPVKNKLFVFCIMLSLWVYMLYCCVGYCSTTPTFMMDERSNRRALQRQDPEMLLKSQSRDLLNNDSDADSRGDGWEENKGDAAYDEDDSGIAGAVNGSESKKLPQAIIIGVKKGGTRALLEFLRLHPDIRAVGAEPHFFDRNYEKGLEWYRELMPKTLDGQLTMEKTPSYFVTKEVPGRIHAMSRDTKLIVVVRDPVTRAISDYTQTRSKKTRHPILRELDF